MGMKKPDWEKIPIRLSFLSSSDANRILAPQQPAKVNSAALLGLFRDFAARVYFLVSSVVPLSLPFIFSK